MKNMIEVFVNGGEYVITNTVYGLSDKKSAMRKYSFPAKRRNNHEKI